MIAKSFLVYLAAAAAWAQAAERVDLGRLQTGATVSFVRGAGGDWGTEIFGAPPRILQPKTAQLEVYYTEEDIHQLAAGYKTADCVESGSKVTWNAATSPIEGNAAASIALVSRPHVMIIGSSSGARDKPTSDVPARLS